jgi:metal-responsive CopG/Arc/MetJ family transcriptional regulator
MRKPINIMLPAEALELIDRGFEQGARSRFIDEAIKRYIDKVGRS